MHDYYGLTINQMQAFLVCSLDQQSLMTLSGSISISLCACIRERDDSRSVSIVDRTYVFTLLVVLNDLSDVAVHTGMVRRMVSTMATFG